MTFLIDFLGCKVNSYEVEALANTFFANGYKLFDPRLDSFPDIIVVNTCAVTETSVSKDKKLIKKYRKQYPNAILVVMGCYSQYKYNYIANELGANIVLGTSNRTKIYDYIQEFLKNKETIIVHEDNKTSRVYERMNISKYISNTRAYVKIQDGCDNFCSYCLIPYIRGRSRSRLPSDILSEIEDLINNGYKEIILTGVDMASYGLDFDNKITLSDLLEMILSKFDNLYRLRISSLETSLIDDKFLELLKQFDNFANHLHIPLQSGSKKVIKAMNRKYDLPEFKEKVFKIRTIRPDISITTDVIVGFPGENEDDFLESYQTCKEIHFSKIHVFPLSSREGTVASKLSDQVDPKIKKDRVHRLLKLSDELEEEYYAKFYGKQIEFLFEEYDEKLQGFKGHSSNYLQAYIKTDQNLKNKVKKIVFTKENCIKI